ncbi:IS3 family transposase [Desulforamulus hydrothermalis]|uniref:Transposase n=1 Tax=Desulforamulus hydrothermalis Lam5 = DSM 18033 TaxID=1121428 RepID=K8DZ28_9FIRM
MLGVSRSGYYAWENRPKSTRDTENEVLKEEIKSIHKTKQTYGSRKITKELRRKGKLVNHKRVERLMKQEA